MPSKLPNDIPVAVRHLSALTLLGELCRIGDRPMSDAVAVKTSDVVGSGADEKPLYYIWASPRLRSYRGVWNDAAEEKFVDDISTWGPNTDIDHLYPKSWAAAFENTMSHVHLFPVWREVNRSAGGGREKKALEALRSGAARPVFQKNIVYADELQVLKLLGHPVGTSSEPESIFD